MKGPVDTVSIPVPLHEGHLSGLDPASLPFPGQRTCMKNIFHQNLLLTFTLITVVHDADVHVLVHPLGCLLEGQVDMVLLGTKVKLFCATSTTLSEVAKVSKRRALALVPEDCSE